MSLVGDFLSENLYCTLATVTPDGKPWATPLYFGFDASHNLYIRSALNTQHVRNMQQRRDVFVTMYDSTQPLGSAYGLYMECEADELSDASQIDAVLKMMNDRAGMPASNPANFMTDAPKRVFKLTPVRVWVNRAIITKAGYMDSREEVTLR